MNKKLISVCMLLFLCIGSLAACGGKQTAEEEEPIPETITNPDGGVVSTDPWMVEGRIKELKQENMTLLVEGVEWKLTLPEQIQKDIATLNEKGVTIKNGSFVLVYYEEEDGKRQVTRIEKLRAN